MEIELDPKAVARDFVNNRGHLAFVDFLEEYTKRVQDYKTSTGGNSELGAVSRLLSENAKDTIRKLAPSTHPEEPTQDSTINAMVTASPIKQAEILNAFAYRLASGEAGRDIKMDEISKHLNSYGKHLVDRMSTPISEALAGWLDSKRAGSLNKMVGILDDQDDQDFGNIPWTRCLAEHLSPAAIVAFCRIVHSYYKNPNRPINIKTPEERLQHAYRQLRDTLGE